MIGSTVKWRFGIKDDVSTFFVAIFEDIIGGRFGVGLVTKDELSKSDFRKTSIDVFFHGRVKVVDGFEFVGIGELVVVEFFVIIGGEVIEMRLGETLGGEDDT